MTGLAPGRWYFYRFMLGDAVSPASWQDVWLNESFATYGEWMWTDHTGRRTIEESARRALQESRVTSPAEPGRNLFGYEVYDGGAGYTAAKHAQGALHRTLRGVASLLAPRR